MPTTFFLVRHAAHDLLGRILTGRMPQIHLGEAGRRQARLLGRHFARLGVTAVQTSPRERAAETAWPIAFQAQLPLETVAALDEIDMGEWTGRSFEGLSSDLAWHRWNSSRSTARCPGGESMAEVQARVLDHLAAQRARYPEGRIVMVSHADVIKAGLLHFLGRSLDEFWTFEIAPAAISTVVLDGDGARVIGVNERVAA